MTPTLYQKNGALKVLRQWRSDNENAVGYSPEGLAKIVAIIVTAAAISYAVVRRLNRS
jgi:hypothetical protein